MADGFSKLNDAERRILTLLAQGHTAKSIAAETGASLHSVNERLREARRKTGAGSSRELARLFAEGGQEDCDKEIVMGRRPVVPVPKWRVPDWRWIAMTVLALAASAYLLIPHTAPEPQSAPEPPRLLAYQASDGTPLQSGKIEIEFTFDRPMRRGSYSFVRIDEGAYPDCAATPRQSADRRRFYLICNLVAGRDYAIGINVGRFRNFVDDDGIPAEAVKLMFNVR
jgi:DNA-binding CsgD family transcriptional regulator